MLDERVRRKVMRPITRGWDFEEEPLAPKSKAAFDFGDSLFVQVKLKEASPDTLYTVGLNIYEDDVPNLGGIERFAFDSASTCIDGVSKTRINRYELGTIVTNEKGKGKFKVDLPVSSGTLDLQAWIAKGPITRDPVVCFKSGATFGDSVRMTAGDAASLESTPLSFVVTGCGRSGTTFASRLISLLGIHCEHGQVFSTKALETGTVRLLRPGQEAWGEAAAQAAPLLDQLPDGLILFHQVRNPVKVLRSVLGEPFHANYAEMILRHVPGVEPQDPPAVRWMKYWVEWNQLVERAGESEKFRYRRHRLEDLVRLETGTIHQIFETLGSPRPESDYEQAFQALSNNTNQHKRDTTVAWASLPECETKDRMLESAIRYGYTLQELENA